MTITVMRKKNENETKNKGKINEINRKWKISVTASKHLEQFY